MRSGPATMSSGVDASANSAGVTSLTFLSVVCAESATATSSVYGSVWSSGLGGSGVEVVEDLPDAVGLVLALHAGDAHRPHRTAVL